MENKKNVRQELDKCLDEYQKIEKESDSLNFMRPSDIELDEELTAKRVALLGEFAYWTELFIIEIESKEQEEQHQEEEKK